ncbi:MAG: ClbS/DfsB family four-helix bundle protein [Anaerolineales bacterium]|nr:ClbS/DfsB family four-helix bundle protein [Anaerolineales bacterium]
MSGNPDEYLGLPDGKAELLARIDREWKELERAVSLIRGEQMQVPDSGGWSVKDNLAHLAEWERFMRLHHVRGLPPHEVMGVDESMFKAIDEDGLNAILFERNKGRSVADVTDALRASHEQVLRDLADMSFEEMMRQAHAEDPQARPLLAWIVGNTYEHYREHRASIERLTSQ